ncbi:MAG TPA: (2Fe-2S)-binding protein [Acidimicrobiales bacterium]|nr:(2Fe-2S)-binding protein [Acidimicrobiales bacterium]
MVICHCRAISDGLVRAAVAGGAADVDAIVSQCGAGSVCGGCRPAIALLLGDLAVGADPNGPVAVPAAPRSAA